MLVLAFTAQLTIPVGDTQVVVYQSVAHVTVPEHRVEEGLGRGSKCIIYASRCNPTKAALRECEVTLNVKDKCEQFLTTDSKLLKVAPL